MNYGTIINYKYKTMEQTKMEIPAEFQRRLSEIMADNPTVVKLGDGSYEVKGLNVYSIERIFQVMQNTNPIDATKEQLSVKAILSDISAMCEVVAICLCNHYFDEEKSNFETLADMRNVMNRNDRMIELVKAKAKVASKGNMEDYANIVFASFWALDVSSLFRLASLVKAYLDLVTVKQVELATTQNAETLHTVQSAGLGRKGISSAVILGAPTETTDSN